MYSNRGKAQDYDLTPKTDGELFKMEEIDPFLIRKLDFSPFFDKYYDKNDDPKLQELNSLNSIIIDKRYGDDELISKIENEFFNSIIDKTIKNQFIDYTSQSYSNLSNFSKLDSVTVTPEDLPRLAVPIVDFIAETKPHIVIGCDRGGRLIALAVHAVWQQTADSPFPTLDGCIHFARISKSEDPSVLQKRIDEIISQSLKTGSQKGKQVQQNEQLRVLFLDDWVYGGGTKRLSEELVRKYNAQTYFGVMAGGGGDVTGQEEGASVSWHDNPKELGINYLSTLTEGNNGTIEQSQKVLAVRGLQVISVRRRIYSSARKLSKKDSTQAA